MSRRLGQVSDIALEGLGGHQALFIMAIEDEYGPCLAQRIRPLMVGVGPIESAISVSTALQHLHDRGRLPDVVVSLGSAGSNQLRRGEIYQVRSVSWRDIDASAIGVPKGLTPFCDHPLEIPLPTPVATLASAKLSTGANVVMAHAFGGIDAHMVDMETFSICRACQRIWIPLVGLRGISDGDRNLEGYQDWASMLPILDERLAAAIDSLETVTTEDPTWLAAERIAWQATEQLI